VISEVGKWTNIRSSEACTWNLSWRRVLFVWEEEQEEQLNSLTNTAQWKKSVSDGWIWDEGDLKKYTVGFKYTVLSEFDSHSINIWFRELWSLKVVGST